MEKIITFVAKDGTQFKDGLLCAEHELDCEPDVVDKINDVYRKYKDDMHRWCSSQACACMGCANHSFYNLGLDEEHHKVWLTKFRSSMSPNGYDIAKRMKIVLLETSSVPNLVLYLKRQHFFSHLSTVDLYSKVKSGVIFENDENYMIESVLRYLSQYDDAKFKVTN